MKKNTILKLIIALVILYLINSLFFKSDIRQLSDSVRQKIGPKLDSIKKFVENENRWFDSVHYLMSSRKTKEAHSAINQLLNEDYGDPALHVLKGECYDIERKYDSAIREYNIALGIDQYSEARIKRAETYLKMDDYPDAIDDYRQVAIMSDSYNRQLAQVFERVKQKDSALKYYHIYLARYPDSVIQNKVNLLQR